MGSTRISYNISPSGSNIQREKEYWLRKLQGQISMSSFPADYKHNGNDNYCCSSVKTRIRGKVYERLALLANRSVYSVNAFLVCCVNILLNRYTDDDDIIIGMPTFKQDFSAKYINNILALRNHIDNNKTFKEVLFSVRDVISEASENQNVPINTIMDLLDIKNADKGLPLFRTIVLMTNIHKRSDIDGLMADMSFLFTMGDDGIDAELEYNMNLYKEETARRLLAHLSNLIDVVVIKPNIKISEIDIISDEEMNQILYKFNDTGTYCYRRETIQEIFEKQAEKSPNSIAAVYNDKYLTYEELNRKSNQLARVLREKGVTRDSIVGILSERSLEMLVSILAVIKAGGAYMPIGADFPDERISYMLQDSRAGFLLTNIHNRDLNSFDAEVLYIDDESIYTGDAANPEAINAPEDLVYVMYTSGSAGRPKGVMIEHHSLVNRLNWMHKNYPVSKEGAVLQKTPYTFDVSVWEMFLWMWGGARLCFLEPGKEKDPAAIAEAIEKYGITHIHFVPSMLSVFMDYTEGTDRTRVFRYLKNVFASGEVLTPQHVRRFSRLTAKEGGIMLTNLYGPTEATIDISYFDCPASDDISVVPIGKPIDNTKLYIMDKYKRLQPIGIPGELYIGGENVGRGYLNNSELTADKFIPNPYCEGDRLYRTGDIARWTTDGNIEFLGRADDQVKIRGMRIELEEINYWLSECPSVRDSAVIYKEDNKDGRLIAYYVPADGAEAEDIRKFLLSKLPEYMVPSFFIRIDSMPLNQNGKVDKNALAKLDTNFARKTQYEAPQNETEETLKSLWQEILGIEDAGVNDNFFEIGGHSLKAVQLALKICKIFNTDISLRDIFENQTIRKLARYISDTDKTASPPIHKAEEKLYYPLSSAQQRLYIISQFEESTTSYNLPVVLEITGGIDRKRISDALKKIIERHEVLRTRFETVNGEVFQKVLPEADINMQYIRLNPHTDEGSLRVKIQELIKPFRLEEENLLRAWLLELSNKSHYLVLDMHHIVSDGITLDIIVRDLVKLYKGEELAELTLQYKDYSEWQNSLFERGLLKKQEKYWLKLLGGTIPQLNMPTDYRRPPIQSFDGNTVKFDIDKKLSRDLARLAQQYNVTLYVLLLAAYNVLLFRYTGQEDIIVGSPVSGRTHPDLENVAGMFANMLALRNHPQGSKAFRDFLLEVRDNCLDAYDNMDYQFEKLVEKLEVHRDISRNPLFDTVFTLERTENPCYKIDDLEFKHIDFRTNTSKYDLTLTCRETNGGINFIFEYCTRLYKKETVERLAVHFINILKSVTENADCKLSQLNMLSDEEKNQILYQFNNTKTDYPSWASIPDLFREIVMHNPDKVAVVYGDESMTYRQLDKASDKVAGYLTSIAEAPGKITGIWAKPSLLVIPVLLGILKAGNAYLPLDIKSPRKRIIDVLSDCSANLILTCGNEPDSLKSIPQCKVINAKDIIDGGHFLAECLTEKAPGPSDPAYIMYTSGSTGKPKGCAITHRNVVRLVKNIDYVRLDATDKILQTGSLSFDASTFEIWGSLLNGLTLYMIDIDRLLDTEYFKNALKKYGITTLWLTSPLFSQFAEYDPAMFSCLKNLLVGGDVLSPRYVNNVRRVCRDLNIYNCYGPTENTTFTTCHLIDKEYDDSIPVGKPINNTTVYIVDQYFNLQPIGVPGELCTGGDGVAMGYMNSPELNSQRFVPNPFIPGVILYKTGDIAKWHPDGSIEFIGRADRQVKINGYRVELAEIEYWLLKHPDVDKAVILDNIDGSGQKQLYAYISPLREVSAGDIRDWLSRKIPEYMIPSYFVFLDQMPLNTNGKVDTEALKAFGKGTGAETGHEENLCGNEELLKRIWCDVLELSSISINDNFFEIGGHSMKALRVVHRARSCGLDITVKDIFRYRTIHGIIKNIESDKSHGFEAAVTGNVPGNIMAAAGERKAKYSVDAENVKELIIKLQKNITTYLFRSLPLCAILADNCSLPWYYSHYCQICSQTFGNEYIMLDYMEPFNIEEEMAECIYSGYDKLKNIGNIVDYVINMINSGYYVMVCLDEYYLSGKASYMKDHFVHESLIYGYDNMAKSFKAVGFTRENVLDRMDFDFDMFGKAYEEGKKYYSDWAWYANERAVELIRPKYGYTEFDIKGFLNDLAGYVRSYGDPKRTCMITPPLGEKADKNNISSCIAFRYGLDVYDDVLKGLEYMLRGRRIIDYRAFHLIAEHKKGLLNRLEYIITNNQLTGSIIGLVKTYGTLVSETEEIRLTFFEVEYSRDISIAQKQSMIHRIMEELKKIKETESIILSQIYNILSKITECSIDPAIASLF